MNNLKSLPDSFGNLIGDVPVSEQLAAVIERMAPKNHTHSEHVSKDEVEDLKRKIEILMNLIGDTPISEQIHTAIKNIK